MRCIFCKNPSSNSKSIEHIVPESLGNMEHILPPGIVCDKCNNYFSREIEGPVLSQSYFRDARHRMSIPNKRKRIPPIKGHIWQSGTEIEISKERDGSNSICAVKENEESAFIGLLASGGEFTGVFPFRPEPIKDSDQRLSRFVGKMAIETLAKKCLEINMDLDSHVIDRKELEPLKKLVRYGGLKEPWPISIRRIYPEDFLFSEDGRCFEMLHEFDFLITETKEWYFVFANFGIEYVINLGGPYLDGSERWLKNNGNKSPLYRDKKKSA
jgi:hypothetical protein